MTTPIAELAGVTVTYRGLLADHTALTGVDLCVHDEAVTGLIGRNGAGKTTLMRLLAGRLGHHTGRVTINGVRTSKVGQSAIMTGDRWSYGSDQSVGSLLKHLQRSYPDYDRKRALDLLDRFHVRLSGLSLSRGQRSAALACLALAARAPLTMLDEPWLGLDAPSRALLGEVIIEEQLDHPRAMLVSTHLIDESADLFEHVVILDRGRVVAASNTDALLTAYARAEGPTSVIAGLPIVGSVRQLGAQSSAMVPREAARHPELRLTSPSLEDLSAALTETSAS